MSDGVRLLDCKNMRCPIPIAKMALALRSLDEGDELLVEATDPAFLVDVRAWSRLSGNPIAEEQDGPVKRVRVRKGAAH